MLDNREIPHEFRWNEEDGTERVCQLPKTKEGICWLRDALGGVYCDMVFNDRMCQICSVAPADTRMCGYWECWPCNKKRSQD